MVASYPNEHLAALTEQAARNGLLTGAYGDHRRTVGEPLAGTAFVVTERFDG